LAGFLGLFIVPKFLPTHNTQMRDGRFSLWLWCGCDSNQLTINMKK
jgi:hypothetical protein